MKQHLVTSGTVQAVFCLTRAAECNSVRVSLPKPRLKPTDLSAKAGNVAAIAVLRELRPWVFRREAGQTEKCWARAGGSIGRWTEGQCNQGAE